MLNTIRVSYTSCTTLYKAKKLLADLPHLLALDFEVQSIYSNAERLEAKELLSIDLDRPTERLCKVVANSSGLSFPSITRITHMNIAWSKDEALVVIVSNPQMERYILDWIVSSNHHFILHNSLFDLKQVYVKTGKIPSSYDDTQLLAKTYINHTQNYKSKVGLKELMGQYYDPKWTMIEGYNNEDLKNEAFLYYSATDACATYLLYEQLQDHRKELL